MRFDPGPCPICGAAHTACTSGSGPILVVQQPARDAAAAIDAPGPPLVAEIVQATLPPGQVTSGTYRRPKKGPSGS